MLFGAFRPQTTPEDKKVTNSNRGAYFGFPVELAGVGGLHAAFLNESRTRGSWWCPVQEIRIRGPKMMGEAQRSLSLRLLALQPLAGSRRCDSCLARCHRSDNR